MFISGKNKLRDAENDETEQLIRHTYNSSEKDTEGFVRQKESERPSSHQLYAPINQFHAEKKSKPATSRKWPYQLLIILALIAYIGYFYFLQMTTFYFPGWNYSHSRMKDLKEETIFVPDSSKRHNEPSIKEQIDRIVMDSDDFLNHKVRTGQGKEAINSTAGSLHFTEPGGKNFFHEDPENFKHGGSSLEEREMEYAAMQSTWHEFTPDDLKMTFPNGKVAYRLPFADDKELADEVLEVFTNSVIFPSEIVCKIEKGIQKPHDSFLHQISGVWHMLMWDEGVQRPHLIHGRVVYEKKVEGIHSKPGKPIYYIYYDHFNNSWVISNKLVFWKKDPVEAYLPVGCMLPTSSDENVDLSLRDMKITDQSHSTWFLNDYKSTKKAAPFHFVASPDAKDIPLTYNQVTLYKERNEENFALDDEDDEMDEHHNNHIEEESQAMGDSHINGLPNNFRTYQHHITHPVIPTYHTMNVLHPIYDHKYILRNTRDFLATHYHPDIHGLEIDVHNKNPLRHPIRHTVKPLMLEKYDEPKATDNPWGFSDDNSDDDSDFNTMQDDESSAGESDEYQTNGINRAKSTYKLQNEAEEDYDPFSDGAYGWDEY